MKDFGFTNIEEFSVFKYSLIRQVILQSCKSIL